MLNSEQTAEEIYNFIDQYWRKNNVPPSVMEVRNGTGVSSTAGVELWLERLVRAGRLAKAVPPTPAWVPDALEKCKDD